MTEVEKAHDILSELMKGNSSYSKGESFPQSELSSPTLREHLSANGQTPVAAVVACADSRVAPEIVFGAGLGKLFVVRNAGNATWSDSIVGSLEYAVQALGVTLVIVMGHSKCGAVSAAVEAARTDEGGGDSALSMHVGMIADVVRCDVEKEDPVGEAVVTNVKSGVERLVAGDSGVAKMAEEGKVYVTGAVYDITTGLVTEV